MFINEHLLRSTNKLSVMIFTQPEFCDLWHSYTQFLAIASHMIQDSRGVLVGIEQTIISIRRLTKI